MLDPVVPNLFFSKKMRFFSFQMEVYIYARHIFPALNLKLMAIIRTTKLKCSLFGAIIQKEGLFYKGLGNTCFCIFLVTEIGLFAKKFMIYASGYCSK